MYEKLNFGSKSGTCRSWDKKDIQHLNTVLHTVFEIVQKIVKENNIKTKSMLNFFKIPEILKTKIMLEQKILCLKNIF